jgi:hypothetical protein
MMGYNNGKIAVSQRQLVEVLGCSPRKVVRGIAELMEHGLIDVQTEGKWKERMAREYRLTFVSTKTRSATNEYVHWKPTLKSGATPSVSRTFQSDTGVKAGVADPVSAEVTPLHPRRRKTANSEKPPAAEEVSLIFKPYVVTASWWAADRYLQANRAILFLYRIEALRAAA